MLGGPDGLGAGGWTNSVVEKAMPVDFQVKNTKIEAVGALAMIMHASEIAQGNYWQKKIAEESLKVMGAMYYCGILQFTGLGDAWLWGDKNGMLRVGQNRSAMMQRIRNMTPQDMPDFQPSVQMALASLQSVNASIKHCILSDGDPAPPASGLCRFTIADRVIHASPSVRPAGHQTLQILPIKQVATHGYRCSSADLQRKAMWVAHTLRTGGRVYPRLFFFLYPGK